MSKRTKEEQTVEKFNHASGEIRSDRAKCQVLPDVIYIGDHIRN